MKTREASGEKGANLYSILYEKQILNSTIDQGYIIKRRMPNMISMNKT